MNRDYEVLRALASDLAEIAQMPVQQEKKAMWVSHNGLKPVRPLICLDQLPWHELQNSIEMKLACSDPYLRMIENRLRETLYKWRHFPGDMVIENHIDIPHEINGLFYGMHVKEKILMTDSRSSVVSHEFEDQLNTMEDVDALPFDKVTVDRKADEEHLQLCSRIFEGILPVRFEGVQIHSGVWDRISQLRRVDSILYDIVDEPEFTVAIVNKMIAITMDTVDQCEALGLLDEKIPTIHCTGAYTDDLPKEGLETGKVTSKNVWSFGMSQIFSTVSPAMHKEFELDLLKPLYERFGLLYYGCCEPLHSKIDVIRDIKNVRKISCSPWSDIDIQADKIAGDYVLSLKPNPAFIAGSFDETSIRAQLVRAAEAGKRRGTPVEFILKDVSTVGYRIDYLDRWHKIAMDIAESYWA